MGRAWQPVTITCNGKTVTFDALLSEDSNYKNSVPAYPTEAGFKVSDSIIVDTPEINMTLMFANYPLTWKDLNGTRNVEANLAMLENIYFEKDVCVVSTTDRLYKNMAIESWRSSKAPDLNYDRQIDIKFKQIVITEQQTIGIDGSYGKAGRTMEQSGNASTSGGTVEVSGTAVSTNAIYQYAVNAGFVS